MSFLQVESNLELEVLYNWSKYLHPVFLQRREAVRRDWDAAELGFSTLKARTHVTTYSLVSLSLSIMDGNKLFID